MKWIRRKYGDDLLILRPSEKSYLDDIEMAIIEGKTVLLENIDETIDAVLEPLLSRTFIKRGTAIKLGDKEVDFNPNFRLILQTKLANPHYKPEVQAQTTIINFTVTREGLEQQLLAEVVKAERPDLEQSKQELTIQQNQFKITLKLLEDELLVRLASAGENVLDDPSLVTNLEDMKKTAAEIEHKAHEAQMTAKQIDNAREIYRCVAERASILYFVLKDLYKINPMYQFSLKAFIIVFKRAIQNTAIQANVGERVVLLLDSITYAVYLHTCRGLFEIDKIVFRMHLAIQILLQSGHISMAELDFLIRFPFTPNLHSPYEFLSATSWGGLKMLSNIDAFCGIDIDLNASLKHWRKFIEHEAPEREKLPGEWKNKTAMQRLCILRTLRPDRMIYAASCFVAETMGSKYAESHDIAFGETYAESSASTPLFFILSPGVDPLQDVQRLGHTMKFTVDMGNFHNVALGQGQEVLAETAINQAMRHGHWVILQNIHLVANWLAALEKIVEETMVCASDAFRLFMTAEVAAAPNLHTIPDAILEASIKITNESPTGVRANIHRALNNFTQEMLVSWLLGHVVRNLWLVVITIVVVVAFVSFILLGTPTRKL